MEWAAKGSALRSDPAYLEGAAPVAGLDAGAGVAPVVGQDGGRHAARAAVLLQSARQLSMQSAPLRKGDQLVCHVPRQHLPCFTPPLENLFTPYKMFPAVMLLQLLPLLGMVTW